MSGMSLAPSSPNFATQQIFNRGKNAAIFEGIVEMHGMFLLVFGGPRQTLSAPAAATPSASRSPENQLLDVLHTEAASLSPRASKLPGPTTGRVVAGFQRLEVASTTLANGLSLASSSAT